MVPTLLTTLDMYNYELILVTNDDVEAICKFGLSNLFPHDTTNILKRGNNNQDYFINFEDIFHSRHK